MSGIEQNLRKKYRDTLDGMADNGMLDEAITIEDYLNHVVSANFKLKEKMRGMIALPDAPKSLEEGHPINHPIEQREHIQDTIQALAEMTPTRTRSRRKSKRQRDSARRKAEHNGQ